MERGLDLWCLIAMRECQSRPKIFKVKKLFLVLVQLDFRRFLGTLYWGRTSVGQDVVGQNFVGQDATGAISLGQNVVGQKFVGQDVTGAISLGQNVVGQEVSGAGHRGAELRLAGRRWGNIPHGAGGSGAGSREQHIFNVDINQNQLHDLQRCSTAVYPANCRSPRTRTNSGELERTRANSARIRQRFANYTDTPPNSGERSPEYAESSPEFGGVRPGSPEFARTSPRTGEWFARKFVRGKKYIHF